MYMLPYEIRRPIPNCKTFNEVSNMGNIRGFNRYGVLKKRTIISNKKYRGARFLLYNGKLKYYSIHRLVAYAFLGLDLNNPKEIVMHIDDDTSNNKLSNLRIGTSLDNMRDCISKGRLNDRKGVKNGGSKLKDFQVVEIKKCFISKGRINFTSIGRKYGICRQAIASIYYNEARTHINI